MRLSAECDWKETLVAGDLPGAVDALTDVLDVVHDALLVCGRHQLAELAHELVGVPPQRRLAIHLLHAAMQKLRSVP